MAKKGLLVSADEQIRYESVQSYLQGEISLVELANRLHSLMSIKVPMVRIQFHQWQVLREKTKSAQTKTHLLVTASQTHIQNRRAQMRQMRRAHETRRRRV
ncbi:MAG: hypothetical protein RL189_2814 [Pseudomonadota bacterium]